MTETVLFQTLYLAPDNLRFCWQLENGKIFCIWNSKKTSQLLIDSDQLEKTNSVTESIAAATGRSAGAASKVLPLLFNKPGGSTLINLLRNPEFVRREEQSAVECFVLRGRMFENDYSTIWISASDFLIRLVKTEIFSGGDKFFGNYEYNYAEFDVLGDSEFSEPAIASLPQTLAT